MVAPLDWGLGHATRCIPVVLMLLQQNCKVAIAAEGACKYLLQQEFPDLIFIELKGYRMKYSRSKHLMPVKLLVQLPKILYRIYTEHCWLNKIVKLYDIDAIISDNRPGLYHKIVPCVYITHQLKIKTGNRFTEMVAQKIHYRFINKYNECWVPDAAGEINLAGSLSHPEILPAVPVKYLGSLSRFEKKEMELLFDLAIILSGPEPQRTVFENIIFEELKHYQGKVFMLRGLPQKKLLNSVNSPSLIIHDHLPAGALNLAMEQSKIIISRSGYTTVMDLIKLQKRAVLVPTPGQTEQEYLANHLMQQKLFYCTKQQGFSLLDILKNAASFSYKEIHLPQQVYKIVIENFIKRITGEI